MLEGSTPSDPRKKKRVENQKLNHKKIFPWSSGKTLDFHSKDIGSIPVGKIFKRAHSLMVKLITHNGSDIGSNPVELNLGQVT